MPDILQFKKSFLKNPPDRFELELSRYIDIPYYISNDQKFESNKHFTILATRELTIDELINYVNGLEFKDINTFKPTRELTSTSINDGYEKISIFKQWFDVGKFLDAKTLLYKKFVKNLNSPNYCGCCFDLIEENFQDYLKEMTSNSLTIVCDRKLKIDESIPQVDMNLNIFQIPNQDDYILILKNKKLGVDKIIKYLQKGESKWGLSRGFNNHNNKFKLFLGDLVYLDYKSEFLKHSRHRKRQYLKKQKLVKELNFSYETIFNQLNHQSFKLNEYKHLKSIKPISTNFHGLNYQIHSSLYNEGFLSISTAKPKYKQLDEFYKQAGEPIKITKFNFQLNNRPIPHCFLSTLESNEVYKSLRHCINYENLYSCESCLYPLGQGDSIEYLENFKTLNNVLHFNIYNSMFSEITINELLNLIENNEVEEVIEHYNLYKFEFNNENQSDMNLSDDDSNDEPSPNQFLLILIPEKAKTTIDEVLDILQVTYDEIYDDGSCESYIKSFRLWSHLYLDYKSGSKILDSKL